jgi:phosphoenolpyruvate carboxylase
MGAYQTLIHHPEFWSWYITVTPIEHISHLPIASRPVSRAATSEVDFEGLRAIPWGFAWIQTRYLAPGWYGVGEGLDRMREGEGVDMAMLKRMYREWPFFQTLARNAMREMARARLVIARRYGRLYPSSSGTQTLHDAIEAEFNRARRALLELSGQRELLDHQPVIQKSIALRNPYTDALNLLQIELMRRFRNVGEKEREPIRHALFLSISGIAAAMQSTG